MLTVLCYLEANPLRANMVQDLRADSWRSYPVHGLGQASDLSSEAPVWAQLGPTAEARQTYWRRWLHEPMTERELTDLRQSVLSGWPDRKRGRSSFR